MIPDTPLVQEARQILTAAASEAIVNHSMRTYLLAQAYAQKRSKAFDEEGLLLAALFHDLGLCPSHRDRSLPFQVIGSRALRGFLRDRGVPEERAAPLAEAIDFHFLFYPRWSRGAEVGLLQVGAWIDMTGLRRWEVVAEAKEIERAYPRLDIARGFAQSFLGSLGSASSCLGLFFPARFGGST